jgi:hypothetical protein
LSRGQRAAANTVSDALHFRPPIWQQDHLLGTTAGIPRLVAEAAKPRAFLEIRSNRRPYGSRPIRFPVPRGK